MNDQECKLIPEIINININESSFYPYSVKINKCSGSWNNTTSMIHMQHYVFLMLLKTTVKVFNIMSRINETRQIKWHETCKCKCRLDESVWGNKQRWNVVDVNVKNWLTKEYVITDLFRILTTVNANVINYVMLENI